ncbi:MAG TPA: hypothetical protein DEB12_07520 [Porphyromonadaceae bacterium]|nr:hypothetical protein [Porphyromonadaceae bacterium]
MDAKAEKIKIKVNVSPRYKEIEVSFPYYVKDGFVLVKFFDRNKGIMVADYGFSKHIQYMDMPEDWITFKPTTEAVFNKAFDKVMNFLTKHK